MKLRKRGFALYILTALFVLCSFSWLTGFAFRRNEPALATFTMLGCLCGVGLVLGIYDAPKFFRRFRWADADWPYDARRKGWLARHRFPEVHSGSEPQWCYLAMFDCSSHGTPTREEMRMLVSYLEFIRGNLRIAMNGNLGTEERPFDIASTFIWRTVVFHKFGEEDWGFRRSRSSHSGYWPRATAYPGGRLFPLAPHRVSLLAVLNEVNTVGGRQAREWEDWKRLNPRVFARGGFRTPRGLT